MEFYLVEGFSNAAFHESLAALLGQGWRVEPGSVRAHQLYDPKTDEWSFYYVALVVRRKRLSQRFLEWRDRWWSNGRQYQCPMKK